MAISERNPAVAPSRRWVMWSLPALLFLIGFFHRAAPGVIARDLMHVFAISSATVGWLAGAYFYSYAGLMVPAGLLVDAYGVRRVMTIGGVVMGVGALIMATASSLPLLFAGRLLVGAGAAPTFVGTLKIAAAWFPPAQFGFLAALTATVGVLGALVSTLPLAALVTLGGWRTAFAGVGVVTLAGAALCAFGVRDRPPGVAAPPAGRLRDVYGLGLGPAAFYATATSVALLIAAPLIGFASDRLLGRRKAPLLALGVVQAALWLVFVGTLGVLPLALFYALLFAMGLAGAAFVLVWPIGREVNPPELDGVAVAVVNLGGFLGAALTQGPIGAVLDARWTGALAEGVRRYPVEAYRDAFTICAALAAAAALLTLLMRETRGRNIYRELWSLRDTV